MSENRWRESEFLVTGSWTGCFDSMTRVRARCPAGAAIEVAKKEGPGCYVVVDEEQNRMCRYRVKLMAEPMMAKQEEDFESDLEER